MFLCIIFSGMTKSRLQNSTLVRSLEIGRVLSCVLLAAFLLGGTGVEDVSGKPLTLEQAIDLVLERNEIPRIATLRVEQAKAARRGAYAGLLPTLSVSGTYTRRAKEISRDMNGEQIILQSKNALGTNAQARIDLFDPSAFPLIGGATSDIEAAVLMRLESERTLCFDVAESFFAVLSAERLVNAAKKRDELSQGVLNQMKARLEAGLAGVNEVTRSELELESAKLAVTTAQSSVEFARLSLGYLIDETVDGPLVEPSMRIEVGKDPVALEQQAVYERGDLKAGRATAEATRKRSKEPWMRLIPGIGVLATWRATNEPGISNMSTDWNVATTLTWVLYDGGLRYAEARRLAAEYEIVTLETKALRRRVGFEVRSALTSLKTAQAAVEQAEARLVVAQKNAIEVRERFVHGLSTALEQADAAVSEFEATVEVERQKLNGRVATLSLLRALGRWPVEKSN
jgi:outer membrane protein TolC